MPGFTRPLASRVWRNALIGVIAVGSLTAGVTLALTVGAARATKPIVPAPDYLLSKQPAPAFTLTDQNGTPVSLAAEKGHVVLLTFMDPQCTLLCPIMGQDIAAVEKRLPKGLDPVLLIVSVAPGRDRADVDHFMATGHLNWLPGWHWLLGPSDVALKLAWASWHIAVEPTAGDINHDALLDVIDSSGHLRVTFPAPLPVFDVVSAIDTVART